MRFLAAFFFFFPYLIFAQEYRHIVLVPWNQGITTDFDSSNYISYLLPLNEDGSQILFVKMKLSCSADANSIKIGKPKYNKLLDLGQNASLPELGFRAKPSVFKERELFFMVFELQVSWNSQKDEPLQLLEFELIYSKASQSASYKPNYVLNSVLSDGYWQKIAVSHDGVFFLANNKLKEMGFLNPEDVKIFGNEARMLPEQNSLQVESDLIQLPVYQTDTGLFFYGQGTDIIEYDTVTSCISLKKHLYDSKNYYFLTNFSGQALTWPVEQLNTGFPDSIVNDFIELQFYEPDTINLLQSGKQWLSEDLSTKGSFSYSADLTGYVSGSAVKLTSRVLARAAQSSEFSIMMDDTKVTESNLLPILLNNVTTDYASANVMSASFLPAFPVFPVTVFFSKPEGEPSAQGWLDYIYLQYIRKLNLNSGSIHFTNLGFFRNNKRVKYTVESDKALKIINVTNSLFPKEVTLIQNELLYNFSDDNSRFSIFYAFNPANCPEPEIIGEVVNQNLHAIESADLVIVTAPEFVAAAFRLADFHKSEGLQVEVVTTEQVYNEFSSGKADVGAIRNFVRKIYSSESILSYILLFGDGSYNNLSATNEAMPVIPTYQSNASMKKTDSFVSDDFFGLLDENEGGNIGLLDIGIGRLPVMSKNEANSLVDKIITYASNQDETNWLNSFCFAADDEDSNLHMEQADSIASFSNKSIPYSQINKIYFDAYTQQSSVTGDHYPEAFNSVAKMIDQGSLIFNYTGHGSESGLSSEQVITAGEVLAWQNRSRLPLFITATCEFSRFDDDEKVSAGELLLLNPNGGGIGLLSTTRLSFSTPNFVMNLNFFKTLQECEKGEEKLGTLIMKTKNRTGFGSNQRNFTLLGDPALRLAVPVNQVIIDSMTSAGNDDTLAPLSFSKVYGHIANTNGEVIETAQGSIFCSMFGKSIIRQTLANDGGTNFSFQDNGPLLFRGSASVNQGYFHFTFIVPKSMEGAAGWGKLNLFSNSVLKGAGGNKKICFGGKLPENISDNEGPKMTIRFNDTEYQQGEYVSQNIKFKVILEDSSGINLGNAELGRDIIAIIDGDVANSLVLNESYRTETDNFRKGTVEFSPSQFLDGKHTILIIAWDVCENKSELLLEFEVKGNNELHIDRVFNYPNPMVGKTGFYFSHNLPGSSFETTIHIFSPSGKLVKSVSTNIQSSGTLSGPILWNGEDDFGNRPGRGSYFYQISVKTPDGQSFRKMEKLVLLK